MWRMQSCRYFAISKAAFQINEERVQECNENRSHGVGWWVKSSRLPTTRKRTWIRTILTKEDPCEDVPILLTPSWCIIPLIITRPLGDVGQCGGKEFKRTPGEGSSGPSPWLREKVRSKVGRFPGFGLFSEAHARAWVGRLQSVALLGNTAGSPIFYSAPDGTTCHPHPLCQGMSPKFNIELSWSLL